jgi:hypothetical protein
MKHINVIFVSVISGLDRGVNEMFALLEVTQRRLVVSY